VQTIFELHRHFIILW